MPAPLKSSVAGTLRIGPCLPLLLHPAPRICLFQGVAASVFKQPSPAVPLHSGMSFVLFSSWNLRQSINILLIWYHRLPSPPPPPEQSTPIFTHANSGVLSISSKLFFLWVYSPEWNYQVRGYEQFYGSYYMSLDCCPERLNQFLVLPTAYLSPQSHRH